MTGGRELFDGRVHVHYGQAYVESTGGFGVADATTTFRGQANGLCGARVTGFLFLVTGLHTGSVGFRVEAHAGPPALTDEWEEAVEVSFRALTSDVRLTQWAGEAAFPLELASGDYRVRYSARGMDAGHDRDVVHAYEPVVDSYLLQFWPDPEPRADAILRQTGRQAAYWHGAWNKA